ncbi:MAG: hypothetical protein AB1416_02395 [Actinomycetota bacterium]
MAIELADEERVALQAWTRRRTSAAALSQRARIMLGCAAGQSNTEVGLNRTAVARTWRAFALQAPTDAPYGRSYGSADCDGRRRRFMNAGWSWRGSARRSCRKRGTPFDVTVETATWEDPR